MALKSLSTAALRRELDRRMRGAKKLAAKRDKLARKLAALERELSGLGGAAPYSGKRRGRPPGGRRGRPTGPRRTLPRNKQSLGDALAAAVRVGSVVSPAEAAQRVKASGYKSTAKTFGILVAMRLAGDKRFKRKGRGQYERVAG
jgi:hypothetical protein